ncbi:MAG: amidohydrolase family protein [Chloroflexi bacterium]|nr:amidohydrolase family protein [Chloroflexota bacterium]
MIVDANVSIDKDRYPVERALAALGTARVQRAVVFADARARDLDAQNAYVLAAARAHDLFPFYYVGGNPFTDTRPDTLQVPANLSEYAGIRWHRWVAEGIDRTGALDQAELDWAVNLMESAEFEAMAAAAAYYDLPVMFEESFAVTLEFVLRFPSLDIIIPHLGSRSGGQATMLRALWDRPNVYFETSLAPIDETAVSRVGAGRLLFGSGYPYGDPEAELDKIDRLPIPESVKESIYGDTVTSLLAGYAEERA